MLFLLIYFAFCFQPITAEFENAKRIQPRVPSLFMRRSTEEPLLQRFWQFEKNAQENEKKEPERFHSGPNLMQVLRESMKGDMQKVKKGR